MKFFKFVGLRKVLADRVSLLGFSLAGLLLLALFLFVYFRAPIESESLPLHYNVYFGIDLVGPGRALLIPVGLSLLLWVVNLVLASLAIEREKLAARLLAWFSLLLIALTFLAIVVTQWQIN